MEITVRLYGALGKGVPGHDPLNGLTLDLPEGSKVIDLIEHLKIPRKKVGIISIDGGLAKDTRALSAGNFVRLYRPIFGG
jgi:sulfur carrier protein ThiS